MESISLGATCDSFGSGSRLARFESPSAITSALALLSTFQYNFQPVESFITFVSLQSSYNWYLKLSQFETVFLGLLMLQICFLRYLEILPININNFFLGDPTGRRRRKRSFDSKAINLDCEGDILTRSLFKVLKKLDDGNCLPLALCELESMSGETNTKISAIDRKLPRETFALLNVLKRIAKSRTRQTNSLEQIEFKHQHDYVSNDDNDSNSTGVSNCAVLDGMQVYEDAVLLGVSVTASHYHNSTICEERYSACPLTKQDIEHYVTVLIDANIL